MNKKEAIRLVVEGIREKRGIEPTPGEKPEGSCIGAPGGEIGNLFWAQLVCTDFDSGSWRELNDSEILDQVYKYACF